MSVQAKVGQSTIILVLDTGTSSLILDKKHKSYLSTNNNHLEDISHEAYAIGINGSKESISTFVINGLCIGNTQLPAMQVSFFSLKKINHGRYWKFDGILNPLLLCHGTIGINWKKKQLYIWTPIPNPLKDITEPDKSLANMNRVRE